MSTTGITVPGTSGGSILVSIGTGDYLNLAQQAAFPLSNALCRSSLLVSVIGAGSMVPNAPITKNTTHLAITGAVGVSISATGSGWQYVINDPASPETLMVSNALILSNDVGSDFYASGTSTVAATGGNNYVNATGNFLISTATGNDTIFTSGVGTVAPGAGAYFVSVSGTANYVIAAATGEVIRQGSRIVSVNALGTNATITGSPTPGTANTAALIVTLGGAGNQVYTQAALASITVPGSAGVVVGGTLTGGSLTVLDTGDAAQIATGADATANVIVNGSKTNVFGGAGVLALLAAGGNDTVAMGGGAATVTLTGSAAYVFGNDASGGNLNLVDSSNGGLISLQNEASSAITLSGGSTNVFAGPGTLSLSVTGTNDTISGGTGVETVHATTNALVFAPNSTGYLSFVGGSGGTPPSSAAVASSSARAPRTTRRSLPVHRKRPSSVSPAAMCPSPARRPAACSFMPMPAMKR